MFAAEQGVTYSIMKNKLTLFIISEGRQQLET
jgi:hypothetical protein